MPAPKLVSIIVPAYNEAAIIAGFIKEVTQAAKKYELNFEIIVIENGSHDQTWEILKKINNPYLNSYHLKTAGYGLAIIEGIKKAKGEYGVVFNVDFWDKKFLELTKADLLGADLVCGSKLLPGSKDLRGFNRRLVSWSFNKFLQIMMGFKGTDTHGLKTFRLKKIRNILKNCLTTTGIFDSELVIRSQRAQLKILELPVEVSEIRPARFSIKRIFKTPQDMWQLYRVLNLEGKKQAH